MEFVTSVRISKDDSQYLREHGVSLSYIIKEGVKALRIKDELLKELEYAGRIRK